MSKDIDDKFDQQTLSLPKVVVADGHEMVREGISSKISKLCDVELVAQTSDGYSTIKACRQTEADLLIMDLGLVRPDGKDVLMRVMEHQPDLKVIVTTSDASISNAFFALSRGAISFLPKQVSSEDFVYAVNAALGSFSYLPKDVMAEFVKSRRNVSRVGNIFGLSPRELEIMKACTEGMSTKEVANEMQISVRTVETHKHNIYRKTNCNSLQELSKIAECL